MLLTSKISLTCCRFSTFLGMNNESSHSFNNPDPYSLNTASIAESVQDADAACVACADGIKTWEARVDGLTPGEVTGAVEIGKAVWSNEEGSKSVEGCWVVDDWLEDEKSLDCAA